MGDLTYEFEVSIDYGALYDKLTEKLGCTPEVYASNLPEVEEDFLNYWHAILDGCGEFYRGAPCSCSLEYMEECYPWTKKINVFLREIIKDHPAFDAEEDYMTIAHDW